MSRTAALALLAGLCLGLGPRLHAQQPSAPRPDPQEDALDALQREARARFEASQTTPQERARALTEAAQAAGQAAERIFEGVRARGEAPDDWTLTLARAARTLRDDPDATAPELERLWERAWQREQIAQGRAEPLRVSFDDYLEARLDRLEVEAAWARARKGRPARPGPHPPRDAPPGEDFPADPWAQAKRLALSDEGAARDRARRETAREGLAAAALLNEAGLRGPERLAYWAERLTEVEQADPLTAAERRWRLLHRAEAAREGPPTPREFLRRLATLRDAEARLAEAAAGKGAALSGRTPPELPGDDPLDATDLARGLFEATHADPAGVKRARLDAFRRWFAEETRQHQVGRSPYDPLLEASRRLAEAEGEQGDAAAARERHWRLARAVEEAQRARYEVGGPQLPWLAARFEQLEAERAWLDASRKRK
jgi:hypothetical protein